MPNKHYLCRDDLAILRGQEPRPRKDRLAKLVRQGFLDAQGGITDKGRKAAKDGWVLAERSPLDQKQYEEAAYIAQRLGLDSPAAAIRHAVSVLAAQLRADDTSA